MAEHWVPKVGEWVYSVNSRNEATGPYKVKKITSQGHIRIAINEVATDLYKLNSDGFFEKKSKSVWAGSTLTLKKPIFISCKFTNKAGQSSHRIHGQVWDGNKNLHCPSCAALKKADTILHGRKMVDLNPEEQIHIAKILYYRFLR